MVRTMMQRTAGNFKHHERPDSPKSIEMTTTEGGPDIIHEAAISSTRESEIQLEQILLGLSIYIVQNG